MGLNDEREKLKLAGIWLHTYEPGNKWYDAALEYVKFMVSSDDPVLQAQAQSIADSIGGFV